MTLIQSHALRIGALVELETGERLYVKAHGQVDAVAGPLYTIGLRQGTAARWIVGMPQTELREVHAV